MPLPLSNSAMAWIQRGLVLCFAACSPAPQPEPTITPRPTLPDRPIPTSLPAAIVGGALQPATPETVSLPGGRYVDLTYTAAVQQQVMLSAFALTDDGAGNPLDPVLEVLDADGERLVYSDDGGRSDGDFAPTDPYIEGLILSPGRYTVRLNAFNGAQSGDLLVELVILR